MLLYKSLLLPRWTVGDRVVTVINQHESRTFVTSASTFLTSRSLALPFSSFPFSCPSFILDRSRSSNQDFISCSRWDRALRARKSCSPGANTIWKRRFVAGIPPLLPQKPPSSPKKEEHENIYTLPNFLTMSRLAMTPFIGYLVVEGSHPGLACSLLLCASATDLADGWIARRWRLRTTVGSVIDPIADKALVTVLTAALATKGALPSKF